MKNKIIVIATIVSTLMVGNTFTSMAQMEGSKFEDCNQKYLNWYNLNPKETKIQGVSVDKVYDELLKDKQPKKTIIVAVIDSEVDINHEDLQGNIWKNDQEIPDNGIDDDNNGYIDDIHGWNYLANAQGEQIKYENYEYVRIVRNLNPKYKDVKSEDEVSEEDKAEYALYKKCKEKYEKNRERYQKHKDSDDSIIAKLESCNEIFKEHFKRDGYSKEDILALETSGDEMLTAAKGFMKFLYDQGFTEESFADQVERTNVKYNYYLNIDHTPRTLLNDDVTDITDLNYGNGDVVGTKSGHGTFVTGIIAANRNNEIGINGITNNVKIMGLRVIPIGDERDKDVALAIRYAVDNGANIINMSFGKDFSPEKTMVYEAIKYASDNGVLLVHAAGNDGINTDINKRYPNDNIAENTYAATWVEVGATDRKKGKKLCGIFTNYAKENVDIFAPGVDIFSLCPDNTYMVGSGTSFAAPVFTGVAALLWSYYPELTALEVKDIMFKSATDFSRKKVYIPGVGFSNKDKTRFRELSQTGSIVNAYQAFIMAESMKNNEQE